MKVYFIDYSQNKNTAHPRHIFAPIDVGYCISLLEKKGHEASLLDLRLKLYNLPDIISILKSERPDILLIKPCFHSRKFVLKLASLTKGFINNIFLYGPFASLFSEYFLSKGSPVNGCIIGEVENKITELVHQISDKKAEKIKEVYSNPIRDLDRLPFPRHKLFFDKGYSFYYPINMRKRIRPAFVLSSRGCPDGCGFCSISTRASYGKTYRGRSAEDVVNELAIISALGFNAVYFLDDNFAFDKKRVKEICEGIIKKNINKRLKWAAQCTAQSLDRDVIELMKEAGCSTVCMGIESGDNRILRKLNKNVTKERIREIVNILNEKNVWLVAFFIIGNPTETRQEMLDSLNFCKELLPDMLQLHFFTTYPDSSLYGRRLAENINTTFRPFFEQNFSNIPMSELASIYKYFYTKYYFSSKFIVKFISKQFWFHVMNWRDTLQLIFKTVKFILGDRTDYFLSGVK